ncbi:MAG: glycoside hydrolase family protein [Campylobacteraceae bacterium]|jgi:lysozyme|nr:glycoside hydrolase family protein [Campylobacteraceae bacterium]
MIEIYTLEIPQLKQDEGFRAEAYQDSLGYLTQGYGTKLPLSQYEASRVKNPKKWTEKEAEELLEYRLRASSRAIANKKPFMEKLSSQRQRVIFNMAYQLGVIKLLLFKKFWTALEERDFAKAADEMKDSRWYMQTPKRANRLINRMLEG